MHSLTQRTGGLTRAWSSIKSSLLFEHDGMLVVTPKVGVAIDGAVPSITVLR